MRVEVQHLPQSQVQLQIEIDPEMLGQAVNKAYHNLAGRYRVPGFRPGKAPRALLERQIGPDLLLTEAADICMNDAYAQAIKDHDLQPIGKPDVQSPKSEEIAADKPLSFTATVYVRPIPQLGDYRALRIAPSAPDISSEEVDRVLRTYQEEQAPWQPVEDRPAAAGDLATLRLLATVEDETLVDQEAWEYRLSADESPNLPIPGLSDQVIGMRVGETKDVTLDLGESYTPAEYAGKQMTLHLELTRLDQRATPELDDEFARSVGNFGSVQELRDSLQRSLQGRARQQAMDEYVDNVVQQVVNLSMVDAPPPLIDQEVDEIMRRLQENVERERKISMDTYTRVVGRTIEQLREEARPTAEQRVRTDLVLDAVAEIEGVEVPEQEVEEQVQLVARAPTLSNKERRRLLASADLHDRVRRRLRRRHTINRLLEITRAPGEPAAVVPGEVAPGSQPEATGEATAPQPAAVAATAESPSDQHNEQEK